MEANKGQQVVVNTVLARIIQLAVALLKTADAGSKGALLVNQIQNLVRADRVMLVPIRGNTRIAAASGGMTAAQDSQYSEVINDVRRLFGTATQPCTFSGQDMPEGATDYLKTFLGSMNGVALLWMPLVLPEQEVRYALWVERWNGRQWLEEETKLLDHGMPLFAKGMETPRRSLVPKHWKKGRALILSLILFGALMCLPFRAQVTAPVQVEPLEPLYVFAPFDGIIETLLVQPGEKVTEGVPLFRYDTRVLEKRFQEAVRGVASARAELARLEAAGYDDREARSKIPVQKIEVLQKQAEVDFLQEQLGRAVVKATEGGLILLDDADALVGAAVRTGQLVLRVADPASTRLKIMVPVADSGLLLQNASMDIRLDSDPLHTLAGRTKRIGFDVQLSDDRVPSIQVFGEWVGNATVRPGQRGIVRIQGPDTVLGMQIFRKPLTTLRGWLGI